MIRGCCVEHIMESACPRLCRLDEDGFNLYTTAHYTYIMWLSRTCIPRTGIHTKNTSYSVRMCLGYSCVYQHPSSQPDGCHSSTVENSTFLTACSERLTYETVSSLRLTNARRATAGFDPSHRQLPRLFFTSIVQADWRSNSITVFSSQRRGRPFRGCG